MRTSLPILPVLALLTAPAVARAGLVSFETTPAGATPTDNLVLASPYNDEGVLVRFGFDTNADNAIDQNAVLEAVGGTAGDGFGFQSAAGYDAPVAPHIGGLGGYFLRPATVGPDPGPFIIRYDTVGTGKLVTGAGGEIWDLDAGGGGNERWRLDAYNASDTLLATVHSPVGIDNDLSGSLDGKPWAFAFTGLDGIARIEITFTGTKTTGIGLAFDNLVTTYATVETEAVPEPTTSALMAAAMMCVARRGRSRRR